MPGGEADQRGCRGTRGQRLRERERRDPLGQRLQHAPPGPEPPQRHRGGHDPEADRPPMSTGKNDEAKRRDLGGIVPGPSEANQAARQPEETIQGGGAMDSGRDRSRFTMGRLVDDRQTAPFQTRGSCAGVPSRNSYGRHDPGIAAGVPRRQKHDGPRQEIDERKSEQRAHSKRQSKLGPEDRPLELRTAHGDQSSSGQGSGDGMRGRDGETGTNGQQQPTTGSNEDGDEEGGRKHSAAREETGTEALDQLIGEPEGEEGSQSAGKGSPSQRLPRLCRPWPTRVAMPSELSIAPLAKPSRARRTSNAAVIGS